MRDQSLYTLWKNSILSALGFLQTHSELFKPKCDEGKDIRSRSSFSALSLETPLQRVIEGIEDELLESVDLPALVEHLITNYHFSSGKAAEPGISAQQAKEVIGKHYLVPFIDYYLQRVDSFEFEESAFYEVYSALEEQLFTGSEPNIFFSPLFNFTAGTKTNILFEGDDLSIRPMTEKEMIYTRYYLKEHLSEEDLTKLRFAICHVTDMARKRTAKKEYDSTDVLAVLRLTKPEPVQAPFTIAYPSRPVFNVPLAGPVLIQEVGDVRMPGKIYCLRKVHTQELMTSWQQYRACNGLSRYEIALNKFNDAYKRVYDKDKLIDCWVGLENIFLRGIRDELRYRASLRIAYFLGSTSDERQRIYSAAMKSYDIRSKLVHGANVGERIIHLATSTVLAYLRDSLRLLLDPERANLLKNIERIIIRG